MPEKDEKILIAKILSAHGVRGQVKIRAYTENPEDVTKYSDIYDNNGASYSLHITSIKNDIIIADIDGITSRNQAEKLAGAELYIERDTLPAADDDSYYYVDLIGLEARLSDGSRFGEVVAVDNFGAGDIVEILLTSGKTEMYPFIEMIFPEVGIEQGYITIIPPDVVFVQG